MQIPKTTLWIPPFIIEEMMFYAWKVDAEVGGLGRLEFDTKENDIIIKELYLLEQEVCNAECTIKAAGIASLYEELIAKNEDDKISDINFWWHSHKEMDSFFSGTDDTTMREWNGNFLIALVINREGKMKARLMSKIPVMVIGDIDVAINWYDVAQHDLWKNNVEKKVKKAAPVQPQQQLMQYNWGYGKGGSFQNRREEYYKYNKNVNMGSIHDLTQEEWEKEEKEWEQAEKEIDAECKAAMAGSLASYVRENEIDEDEARAIKQMWGDWEDYGY